jgi:hypothetical protein
MAPIERRIRRIEQAFNADPCRNVDRIMRLPGTMNVLGPTKVRVGRKPERAELIEFHDDRMPRWPQGIAIRAKDCRPCR